MFSRDEVAINCQKSRESGKRIGYTSGSFDILHWGHMSYLMEAKKCCDVLVVGVNSDSSVRSYKGNNRPIIGELDRVRLVDNLKPVDHAFLFDETNNKENIESIKPDFYIKAGDYTSKSLTSAKYLKPWNGEVKIIPFVDGISSTSIIDKLLDHDSTATEMDSKDTTPKKVIFLDRDGTVNEEVEYLHKPEQFKLLPGVLEGLSLLKDLGYKFVIVTNQTGIGLGYFTREDFYKVNKAMFRALKSKEIKIEKIYFCPHGIDEKCSCRKPDTGLLERGKTDIPADMASSFMIGDKTSDILAGERLGLRTVLVKTGHGGRDNEYDVKPDFIADDLLVAAEWIKKQTSK